MTLRPTYFERDTNIEDALTGEPDVSLSRQFLTNSLASPQALVDEFFPLDQKQA